MKSFLSRFIRHWTRAAAQRLWSARMAFGVWSFALICFSVLVSPFLRTVFQVQTSRSSLSHIQPDFPWSKLTRPRAFSIYRLHKRFPDNRDVQLALAAGDYFSYDDTEIADNGDEDDIAYMAQYERNRIEAQKTRQQMCVDLLKRYPDDAIPVALWLGQTASNFRDVRVAGVLENPPTPVPTTTPLFQSNAPTGWNSATSLKDAVSSLMSSALAQTPDADFTPTPTPAPTPSYTRSELSRAIKVAQSGQKLEPKNSYFDWALIYFLLCARRDDEAIRVLDAASRKPFFDDHSCDVVAAFIRARQLVRPTLIEEKWSDVDSNQISFYKHSHIARLLSWIAWQKQQSGDVQSALSIRAALARMSRVFADGRRIGIDGSDETMRTLAWRYDLRPLLSVAPSNKPRVLTLTTRTEADDFAAFAVANNRPEIARETLILASEIKKRNAFYRTYNGFMSSRLEHYTLIGGACFFAIACLLALYVALSILLLLSKPVEVARRDVWATTPFLAFAAVAGVFCLHFALSQLQASGYDSMDLSKETPQTLWMLGIGVALLFLAPLLGNGLWCAAAAWWSARKTPETKTVAPGLAMLRYTQFFVVGSAWFYAIVYSIVALVMKLQGVSSWDVSLPALGEISFDEPWWNLLFIWPIVAGFSLVSWFFYARIFAEPPRTHSLYALRRFRQTLLALVPIYSFLWVAIALLSIPQRRLAEMQLNDLLQHGEVYVAQNIGKYR